jgi:hypothetical protein
MNGCQHAAIAVAAALSPRRLREARREQWLADVRDAEGQGLLPSEVALGALWTTLATKGWRSSPSKELKTERQAHGMVGPRMGGSLTARVFAAAAGFLVVTGVGAGGLAMWVASGVTAVSQSLSGVRGIPSGDPVVTYGSLASEPAPYHTDLSTLRIVGSIDPATGKETDFPARPLIRGKDY